MKKLLALALAGAMVLALPVCAAESPSAGTVSGAATAESSAPAASTESSSANAVIAQAAAAEGKSVVEYVNNAVVEVSGLSETLPIGQGGHVIINGAPSNFVFTLTKPTAAEVNLAKAQATALGGKIVSFVGTKSAINKFETARVNFYIKGIVAGQNIKVYQLVDGAWVELKVAEIRLDHVVVDMTSHGKLLFVEVPSAQ